MADELKLDIPLSPYEFGRWVFDNQRPLQRLTTIDGAKGIQISVSKLRTDCHGDAFMVIEAVSFIRELNQLLHGVMARIKLH